MNGGALVYSVCIGLCVGVAGNLLFHFGILGAELFLAVAVFSVAIGIRYPKFILCAMFFASAVLGLVRADIFLAGEQARNLAPYAQKKAEVVGIVSDDPDKRTTALRVTVAVSTLNGAARSGALIAVLPQETVVEYGDTVELRGAVVLPKPFTTDAGREFDYQSYLRARGVSALMQPATLVKMDPGGWSLQKTLFALKHSFEQSIEKVFPRPQEPLLEGILLGERRGLSQNTTDAFVQSGLIHVVVLSGYNISIISEGVFRGLSFLPSSVSFPLGGVLMILFAVMSGAGATTVRALFMALIALLARYLHRSALALRSLAVVGAVMTFWNPVALLYDPSFVLSMLATFGLITLAPALEKKMRFLPQGKWFNARSIAASTVAVQIFILPALLYFTGVLSFFALPANLLVLPTVPAAMGFGFIAGLLNFFHPLAAFVPAVAANAILLWILFVAREVAALPLASTIVPQFSAWLAAALYIPLTAVAIYLYSQTEPLRHPS